MKINLCPERDNYYVQTNNEVDPFNHCNTTTMIAGLVIGEFGLEPIMKIAGYRQPEDKLTYHMHNDPAVQDFWRRYFNTSISAPQWAGVMVFAINQLYGRKIVYYDDYLDMNDIREDLGKGLPIYTSMRYPDNVNSSGQKSPIDGHIVLIVGIDGEDLIINDPYKNHLTGGKDGFGNIYTPADMKRHNKGYAIRYIRA
jgi:hypothetical protein